MPEQSYEISIKKDRLVFKSTTFRAEDVSALHSGIYNKEMASSLASGAVTLFIFLLLNYVELQMDLIYLVMGVVLFVLLFAIFRSFVFFEPYLRMFIDRAKGKVNIYIKSLHRKRWSFSFKEIEAIRKGFTIIAPKNLDGIKMVRKISVQHGQVIPGLGEVKQYHTVNVELKDGTVIMVFSSYFPSEAEEVLRTLSNFVGGNIA
jgi:hypothetical protein